MKIGLYIGRFQPFHEGHRSIITKALFECDKVIVAVGSSQESMTEKNPFSFIQRKVLIEKCYKHYIKCGILVVIPLPDRQNYGDDSNWGKYVLEKVYEETKLRPTVNYEGEEQCRSTWFEGLDIERVIVSRNILPYSATQVRQALREDDFDAYFRMMPVALLSDYELLQRWLRRADYECKR